MRGVSQIEPNATVVVILSGPFGRSFDSEISPSAIASLAKTSRAVRNSASPCSVRMRPRAWRWKSGTLRLSSSAEIWRETADWLRFSASPAWVKLPASATAWKTRSLSQSIATGLFRRDGGRGLACLRGILVRLQGEEALGFQGGDAARAGRRHRLAPMPVLNVAGRE